MILAMRRLAVCLVLLSAAPLASKAGTLEDMELRSNVEAAIRGTTATAGLHLKISVEKRVAIPEGPVHDMNQADEVVRLASKVRGVADVDRSKLVLEFPDPSDEQVAARVASTLFGSPRYAASKIRISVEHGVVTFTGAVDNASWRGEIRTVVGEIAGVIDLNDQLVSPDTPDPRIQKVLDGIFSARFVPPFPGRVRATVKEGAVHLEGHVPELFHKRLAAQKAMGINGVRSVDNALELSAGQSVKVIDP